MTEKSNKDCVFRELDGQLYFVANLIQKEGPISYQDIMAKSSHPEGAEAARMYFRDTCQIGATGKGWVWLDKEARANYTPEIRLGRVLHQRETVLVRRTVEAP